MLFPEALHFPECVCGSWFPPQDKVKWKLVCVSVFVCGVVCVVRERAGGGGGVWGLNSEINVQLPI